MAYFNTTLTIDEAKNLFRKLCLKLHPDTSGYNSTTEFAQMYNEFKNFKPTDNKESFNSDEFYNLIKNFESLIDVNISFVGSFIWIEDIIFGATYKQRNVIKSINLEGYNNARFAPIKKCWYFSPSNYVQKFKSKKDLNEIKSTYGCKSFTAKKQFQIN